MRSIQSLIFAALTSLTLLAGCGGSGNGGVSGSQTVSGSANNVATMTVNGGPLASTAPNFNIPYVSITICAAGTSTCQTVDNIQVDTGSYGVRIISSALSSSMLSALGQVNAANGNPLVECTQFADGYSWGSVRTADVQISGEKASGIPIQVIGDPGFTYIPSGCSSTGTQEDTVDKFGANGIIGIGTFVQDCGQYCADNATNAYFSCTTGGGACVEVTVALNLQVANPVASFTTDNNGVILELPGIADAGAASATGSLVFGIGTQSNNALSSSAKVFTTDANGDITVTFNGTAYTQSFIDSGSNLYYFVDSSLTQCTLSSQQFYCPSSEQTLSATVQGQNGVTSTVNFNVANAQTEFNSNTAYDNVGAPNSNAQSFDFGLPFFYGRNIYTAIEGTTAGGTTGPYFAF